MKYLEKGLDIRIRSIFALAALLMVSGAQATLIDQGDGFIYDDAQDITWTQNANIALNGTWSSRVAWADGYSQTHTTYGTFDDWRLSTAIELEYMFNDIFQFNTFPFSNLNGLGYWSSTEDTVANAWQVAPGLFSTAGQQTNSISKDQQYFAWAVLDGDITAAAVPEPGSLSLLVLALAGLGFSRRQTKA